MYHWSERFRLNSKVFMNRKRVAVPNEQTSMSTGLQGHTKLTIEEEEFDFSHGLCNFNGFKVFKKLTQ